jgi:hypothetical protein
VNGHTHQWSWQTHNQWVIMDFCLARVIHEHQELVGKAHKMISRGHEFGSISCMTEERIIIGNIFEPGVFPLFMAIGPIIFCVIDH